MNKIRLLTAIILASIFSLSVIPLLDTNGGFIGEKLALKENGTFWIPMLILALIGFAIPYRNILKGSSTSENISESISFQPPIRKGWTEIEKEQIRMRQDGKCNKCGKPPPRWEYHHRDGNRSNNSFNNCEGLCPNCHSVKTHDE